MSRVSRYSHFQPWRDGYYIAFNSRTGAVALMTEANYQTYLQLVDKLSNDGCEAVTGLTPPELELLKQLEYGLFMYRESTDELEALKFQHGMVRYDMTKLGLVLAPTMACNMACPYCYESNKRGKMSPAVIKSIVSFVDKQAGSLDQVDVNWYGGEPLLAMDVISELSETLMRLGTENQFIYTSSIVTNGYLLTKEVVDRLVGYHVSVCQVTLDGPARLHNQKRPLKNGMESYETILENLKYASTKMMVSIRVNVDKSMEAAAIGELLAELKQANLQSQVAVYFAQLEPASISCAAIAETCYDNAGFSDIEIDYCRLLLDQGFRIEKLPRPSATFCMVHRVNAFLIDSEGFLYRCWNHVGDTDKSMGNIHDKINYQHPNFTRLFSFSPFEDEMCRDCSILPICMGGCPAQRTDQGLVGEQMCQSWKHNLTPMLEIIARSRQQQVQATSKEQV
jgi:uncharacterized protein